MVTFYQLVRPTLLALAGRRAEPMLTVSARCEPRMKTKPGRREFQRGEHVDEGARVAVADLDFEAARATASATDGLALAEAIGAYYTQGMPEDTKALEKDVFGNADFMKQAAIIADEAAIGVVNNKTTATRLVPVPGASAGEKVDFGGLFGMMPVIEVRNVGASESFVHFGGRIPAPVQSLRN